MNWLAAVSTFTYIAIVKNKNLFGSGLVSEFGKILLTTKKISTKSHLLGLVTAG